MFTGLPVLTTDWIWVPRLVEDGADMVMPVANAEAFADCLKRLAVNAAPRHRMDAAVCPQVLERHTWLARGMFMNFYRKLVARGLDGGTFPAYWRLLI